MATPADDIATWLDAAPQNYGTVGTDLFVSREPPAPDNTTTLRDVNGVEVPVLDTDQTFADFGDVQLRIRNNSYSAGTTKMDTLKALVKTGTTFNQGGKTYTLIFRSGPAHLGADEDDRELLVINITAFYKTT